MAHTQSPKYQTVKGKRPWIVMCICAEVHRVLFIASLAGATAESNNDSFIENDGNMSNGSFDNYTIVTSIVPVAASMMVTTTDGSNSTVDVHNSTNTTTNTTTAFQRVATTTGTTFVTSIAPVAATTTGTMAKAITTATPTLSTAANATATTAIATTHSVTTTPASTTTIAITTATTATTTSTISTSITTTSTTTTTITTTTATTIVALLTCATNGGRRLARDYIRRLGSFNPGRFLLEAVLQTFIGMAVKDIVGPDEWIPQVVAVHSSTTCKDVCRSYPSSDDAPFCTALSHSHRVPCAVAMDPAVRDGYARNLSKNLLLKLDQNPSTSMSEICRKSIKDSICLDAFPHCHCDDLTAWLITCEAVNLCMASMGNQPLDCKSTISAKISSTSCAKKTFDCETVVHISASVTSGGGGGGVAGAIVGVLFGCCFLAAIAYFVTKKSNS